MFTPKEIRETEFERIVRGYNPDDVDGFLAQIADQIEKLTAERDEAVKKASEASERMDSYREDGDALRSVLVTAEKVKNQMLSEARETSEKTVAEASERAAKLVADAQEKSDAIVGAISGKVDIEEATLKTLKKQVSDFKNSVLNMYKQHLESLSELPEYAEEEERRDHSAPETPAVEATAPAAVEPPASVNKDSLKQLDDTSEFAFPELGAKKPPEAAEKSAAASDAFSFTSASGAPASDGANRFGKLDFGESFTFGAE